MNFIMRALDTISIEVKSFEQHCIQKKVDPRLLIDDPSNFNGY